MSKTIAIVGSRTFTDYNFAKKKINAIFKKYSITPTKIISGGAQGADKVAEQYAHEYKIPIQIMKADWQKFGKSAGPIRNQEIVKLVDVIIAFWDGKSRGTKNTIDTAKKLNKQVIVVSGVTEGVRQDDDGKFIFDFEEDALDDIMKLKYAGGYAAPRRTDGLKSFYTYRLNNKIPLDVRKDFLFHLKDKLPSPKDYELLLNKAVVGLFNNTNFKVSDVDVILVPESSSELNKDVANKIKAKLPNALLVTSAITKNTPTDVKLDIDAMQRKNIKPETIANLQKQLDSIAKTGKFSMKRIPPQYRSFIIDFLKLDTSQRELMNKITDGKVLVVDDYITKGTTFKEVGRLLEFYSPKSTFYYSLISIS